MNTIKVTNAGSVEFIAHRGLSGLETENTCAAFVAAGNRSHVGIETDVMYQWRDLPTYEVRPTRIRNIRAENIKANRADHLLMVYGDSREPVDGVTLVNVVCDEVAKTPLIVVNAKNVTVDGREIPSRAGTAPKK